MFSPRARAARRRKKRSNGPAVPKSKPRPPKMSPKSMPPNRSSAERPATPARPRASYSARFSGSLRTAYFRDLPEPLGRVGRLAAVRVVLEGEFAKRVLDRFLVSVAGHAQRFVIVARIGHGLAVCLPIEWPCRTRRTAARDGDARSRSRSAPPRGVSSLDADERPHVRYASREASLLRRHDNCAYRRPAPPPLRL